MSHMNYCSYCSLMANVPRKQTWSNCWTDITWEISFPPWLFMVSLSPQVTPPWPVRRKYKNSQQNSFGIASSYLLGWLSEGMSQGMPMSEGSEAWEWSLEQSLMCERQEDECNLWILGNWLIIIHWLIIDQPQNWSIHYWQSVGQPVTGFPATISWLLIKFNY